MKSARETHFWPFFVFFHGQNWFFTPTFLPNYELFHGHFFFHGHVFGFFSRVKEFVFTGRNRKKIAFVFNFTGEKLEFFHGHRLQFHGWNFWKISRANFNFHGYFLGDFWTFSRPHFFFTATFSDFSVFLHGYDFNFHGEKKNTVCFGVGRFIVSTY